MAFSVLLLLAAFVLFAIAVFPIPTRFNLIAAGLACWVLSSLVGLLVTLGGIHIG